MTRYLQPALLPIALGLLIGVIASAAVIDTDPAFLGWFLGIGLGLMGGSFLAAIASGESLVGRPAPRRRGQSAAPWLDPSDDD